jgi:AbrB family looped-hinge helix DNA binding protein
MLFSEGRNFRFSERRVSMPIVRVQKKGQITLPVRLRTKAGIGEGDILEASLARGKITLTPKALVDQQIAESMEDYRKGRFYGPFDTHKEFAASLKAKIKKIRR